MYRIFIKLLTEDDHTKKGSHKTAFFRDTIDTKGMRIKCGFPDGGTGKSHMRGDRQENSSTVDLQYQEYVNKSSLKQKNFRKSEKSE